MYGGRCGSAARATWWSCETPFPHSQPTLPSAPSSIYVWKDEVWHVTLTRLLHSNTVYLDRFTLRNS